jgi:amidohydrolase
MQGVLGARDELIDLSRRIHDRPELAFHEVEAARLIVSVLENHGLPVAAPFAGLDTAFDARAGDGAMQVALLAEYDALPTIGHACGHNLIAAASVGAAIAVAPIVADLDLTLRVIGTPGEEIGDGGGKVIMVERGVFDDIHAVLMIHPGAEDVLANPFYAISTFEVRYTGKESHAAMYPELGVNAADAFTIAQTAIGLMRQQLPTTVRVHGVVTHGGAAPNVIPGETRGRYMVRAPSLEELSDARERILPCFDAGAVGSGASLEVIGGDKPYAEVRHDSVLGDAFAENWRLIGRSFPAPRERRAGASTDLGNVSRVVPSIHPLISVGSPPGVVNHQPAFAEVCVTSQAHDVMIDAAVALAWTAIDAAIDERTRQYLVTDKSERRSTQ